jgi:hypothetical protein
VPAGAGASGWIAENGGDPRSYAGAFAASDGVNVAVIAMNSAALTSGAPTRETALLIADPNPARATGTEAIRAMVRGATSIAIPTPKRSVVGRTSTRKPTGGTRLAAESGRATQAPLVAGIREIQKRPAPIRSGPATMKGRS